MNNENTLLFLFDFDGTLVKKSLHSYIGERLWHQVYSPIQQRMFSSVSERDKEILRLTEHHSIKCTKQFLADDNFNWKNEEQLVRLMKNIISSGHKIGIVSFNDYPEAIKYSIEQLLGEKEAENIYIKSGLPSLNYEEIQRCNKVPYIFDGMRKNEIANKAHVFFMDDDIKNIIAAEKEGIKAVLVEEFGTEYIHKAFNFLQEFNESHGINVDLVEPRTEPLMDNESSEENNMEVEFNLLKIGYTPLEKEDMLLGDSHTL
ncbi:hypothetical protein [Rickettsia endosymbiont of Halotydeus destructor]|uniref:hypothetical protein n=1 Tax=Rickettsia endosymbiont of Halotydeus destructor TaxID=2996754 RepID=UPI003BB1C04D